MRLGERRGEPVPTFDDFDLDGLIFGLLRCRRCSAEKPANSEHFVSDRREADGIKRLCRECAREAERRRKLDEGGVKARRMRERYANDPAFRARILARKRKYREAKA